jgi:hypothetical protein
MLKTIQSKLLPLWLLLAGMALLPLRSQALVLDWDSVNWSSGSLSQSFDVDASHAGNDITITITGSTGNLAQNVNDTTDLTGGISGGHESLFMNMNYDNRSQFITVTVTFLYAAGVTDVSFSIFDIDKNTGGNDTGYTDKITVLGTGTNGTLVAPTTITTHTANETVGSGTNIYVRGVSGATDTTGNGNADYAFSSTITNFSFTYGNDSSAPSKPGNQWIALGDITFKPKVPEWHPGLIASLACFALIAARRFFF